MKRIAVLTSGGDAPGMNAAVRAIVRSAAVRGWEVAGIEQGYQGLVDGLFRELRTRDVGGIMQLGGTILGSARSEEFKTPEGQQRAIRQLNKHSIDAVVVIGGNGSQTGSTILHQAGVPVVGVASTIDNDLVGSDITIGVDTALNIALEAIDRLKTTASSHQRAFLIEVMGRGCGYLALMSGIAGGAEAVLIPEVPTDPEKVARTIRSSYEKGKHHAIVVVAEGADYNASRLTEYFSRHRDRLGFSLRTTTLGHVQRGGAPSASDRILGSRLGAGATDALASGHYGVLVGMIKEEVTETPLNDIAGQIKPLDLNLLELARILD